MYYLDRFIKKVCTIEYIYNSDEMIYFSRGKGSIPSNIERLPRLTFAQRVDVLSKSLSVNPVIFKMFFIICCVKQEIYEEIEMQTLANQVRIRYMDISIIIIDHLIQWFLQESRTLFENIQEIVKTLPISKNFKHQS